MKLGFRGYENLKNKIINYNLVNGKLDIKDFEILNPNNQIASYIPDKIQHPFNLLIPYWH